jgi:hypothetical protein
MTSAVITRNFLHNTLALFKICIAFKMHVPSHNKTDTLIFYLPSPSFILLTIHVEDSEKQNRYGISAITETIQLTLAKL